MSRAPRPRWWWWLACLGWLAQLGLPLAHASLMAGARTGTWCGPGTPQLQARLAALAPDLRQALKASSTKASQHDDCVQFCSGGAASAAPASGRVHAPLPRAPSLLAQPACAPSRPSQHAPPPARGPPRHS